MLVLLFAAVSGLHRSSVRPFWFDEIATVVVAAQGSPSRIWSALHEGADAQPPPFYLLEALSGRLADNPHIAYRLPSLLGFVGIPVALWCFVRKRCGVPAALGAALVPFVTPVFTLYAVEARPYALVTCCLAWALVMWQDVNKVGRAAALGCLLVAATSLNYAAVAALFPFALGELVRVVRVRELRIRVWLALLAGCLPLAAFWPLLSRFNREYGASFWAQPKLLDTYGELLGLSERWAAPLVVVLVAGSIASLVPHRQQPARREPSAVPPEEKSVILGFVGLPVILHLASSMLHAPMASRYALSAVLGISVAAAFLTSGSHSRKPVWYLIGTLLAIIGLQQTDYWRFGTFSPTGAVEHADVATLERLMRRSETTGLPIVVSNGLRYLTMAYYRGATSDLPFLYLPDPAGAIKFIRTDSVDRAIVRLAPYTALHLQEPATFYAAHPVFLLFSENELWDFLPRRLVREGHSVRLIATDGSTGANHMLYLIELQSSQAGGGDSPSAVPLITAPGPRLR